jgi:hypothetical protein
MQESLIGFNAVIVLWAYCPLGSIPDLLSNPKGGLDFRYFDFTRHLEVFRQLHTSLGSPEYIILSKLKLT